MSSISREPWRGIRLALLETIPSVRKHFAIMTNEKVLWSSVPKNKKRLNTEYSPLKNSITHEEQAAKKMCISPAASAVLKTSDLKFCNEVKALMGCVGDESQHPESDRHIVEGTNCEKNGQDILTFNHLPSSSSSSSSSWSSPSLVFATDVVVDSCPESVHHDAPPLRAGIHIRTAQLDCAGRVETAVCAATSTSGYNGSDSIDTASLFANGSIPVVDCNYIGGSFKPMSMSMSMSMSTSTAAKSAAGSTGTSSSSTTMNWTGNSFSVPIPCTPLSPWYLSNG